MDTSAILAAIENARAAAAALAGLMIEVEAARNAKANAVAEVRRLAEALAAEG